MEPAHLIDRLTEFFLAALGIATPTIANLGADERAHFEQLSASIRERAKRLLTEAYKAGLSERLTVEEIGSTPLGGGVTAENVFRVASQLQFVAKVDNSSKLVDEARKLIRLTSSGDVPQDVADLFPRVYSAVLDIAPYAYLMESFGTPPYRRFSDLLGQNDTVEAAKRIIRALLRWYDWSADANLIPSLESLYLQRVVERLTAAATVDVRFSGALETGLVVNGQQYDAPSVYLKAIRTRLQSMTPSFVTGVHGDPHPGNIFVSPDSVRLIDVKAWPAGDYIWDVGKLVHYVLVTSVAEDQTEPLTVDAEVTDGCLVLKYTLDIGSARHDVASAILDEVKTFAEAHGDRAWRERLQLSISANLLGLPAARLTKGLHSSAFIFLGEGMRWLAAVALDQADGIVRA